jgi:hypothetical protein
MTSVKAFGILVDGRGEGVEGSEREARPGPEIGLTIKNRRQSGGSGAEREGAKKPKLQNGTATIGYQH